MLTVSLLVRASCRAQLFLKNSISEMETGADSGPFVAVTVITTESTFDADRSKVCESGTSLRVIFFDEPSGNVKVSSAGRRVSTKAFDEPMWRMTAPRSTFSLKVAVIVGALSVPCQSVFVAASNSRLAGWSVDLAAGGDRHRPLDGEGRRDHLADAVDDPWDAAADRLVDEPLE